MLLMMQSKVSNNFSQSLLVYCDFVGPKVESSINLWLTPRLTQYFLHDKYSKNIWGLKEEWKIIQLDINVK